jgi:DNA polymerase I
LITTEPALDKLIANLTESKCFAFDTETTSLDVMNACVVGISVSYQKNQAFYIPFGHQEGEQLDKDLVLLKFKPLLEDSGITKIGQNLKYDINILRKEGLDVKGELFDTMLASYVLNSGGRHDMDRMAERHLGITTTKFEDVCGKGKSQIGFDQVLLENACAYAAEDADVTFKLYAYLKPRVKAIPALNRVFSDIEMPLMPVLAKVEYTGVLIDEDELSTQGKRLSKRAHQLQQEAFSLAACEFNLSSPKQLQEILFEKLELPILKKTPKGQPSTAEPVLQELSYEFPLPQIILQYRSVTKLLSTYVEALPRRVNSQSGRVHTSYNQAVTTTGRLSSSDPNLQNIPVRSKDGRAIRHAFIAPKNAQLIALDYSQIELRIMAHLSKDSGLLQAFANGLDIHAATASEVFDVPLAEVTDEQRRCSKAVNFGLIYGMSAFGLAKQLHISKLEAQEYINTYFARYPGVLDYMDDTRKKAHRDGFVETLFGRRLHLPDINAKNKMLVAASERTAVNAPMQGTAADIIKKAMVSIDKWIGESKQDIRMIMQVHDELVFELPEERLAEFTPVLKEKMETAAVLDVPLEVSIGSGSNWEEAH